MKIVNEMRLTFLSKSSNESFARMTASAFVAQCDPTIDKLADIKTAVSEAVTNCIVHAYRGTTGKITMTIKLMADYWVVISIRDRGCGIPDVHQAMEPCYTSAPSEERSGMGFTVMETFMDKVTVRSKEGKGTTVTMVKRLIPTAAGGAK